MKRTLLVTLSALFANISGCTTTSVMPTSVNQGTGIPWTETITRLQAATAGPVRFQQVIAADWAVAREGLINIDHPKAIAANLKKGDEAIQIYFYLIEHPKHGRFIIDTGLGQVFRGKPESWPVSSLIRSFMNMPSLKVHKTTQEWLAEEKQPLAGVFLTHMHMDHILGSGDVPAQVPFLVGPGEATTRQFQNLVVQGSTDRLLGKNRILRALTFPRPTNKDSSGLSVLDFFGDGSLYVIHAPGHTAGSLAFVAVSETGKHLVLGDTCHTKWGWQNTVPPGDFTADQAENAKSLEKLKALSESIGAITVHPGHQSL